MVPNIWTINTLDCVTKDISQNINNDWHELIYRTNIIYTVKQEKMQKIKHISIVWLHKEITSMWIRKILFIPKRKLRPTWMHLKQHKESPRSLFPWECLYQSRVQNLITTGSQLQLPFHLSIHSSLWNQNPLDPHQRSF